eukprot:2465904-Amphidinium_carterae.1
MEYVERVIEVDSQIAPHRQPQQQGLFDMLDLNHDGVITRSEFNRAATGTYPAPNRRVPARF